MKILSLSTENIKRLKAVEIVPGGEHVVIVGRNEQGKSSVLDSIMYALAGKSVLPERPIRDGESAAKIVIELGDYTVTRTFTAAGGGTLKVEAKDGKVTSPQAVLDSFVGSLTFDPLEFTRLKPAEQADILRKLVGIDTKALDDESTLVYNQRTEVNRSLNTIVAGIGGSRPYDANLPETEIDAKDIIAARQEAEKKNAAVRAAKDVHNALLNTVSQTKTERHSHQSLIESLERQLAAAKEKMILFDAQVATLEDQAAKSATQSFPPVIDLAGFDEQMLDAQQKNYAIRNNNRVRGMIKDKEQLTARSGELTTRLEDLAKRREKLISEAKYPIQGLGFSSTGTVTFNGVPFEQLSTAQRLKISAAIGIALNPKLRVMLIRDGSVMDDETLAELIKVAGAHDTQLWIERVGKTLEGELPGVIIEDGAVAQSTLPQIPEATDPKNTACV